MTIPTKVCAGPAHAGPVLLPILPEYWYFYGDSAWAREKGMVGKPISKCIRCRGIEHPHQLIPVTKIQRFTLELIERCGGYKQAERESGVGERVLRQIALKTKRRGVQKGTAQRILVALSEKREYDRRNGLSERFVEARLAQARIEERLERELRRV